MGISSNTTWIVSCVKWKMNSDGFPDIGHCDSRAYRSEKYARNRYEAIIEGLEEEGFFISELEVPEREMYEGIRAYQKGPRLNRKNTYFAVAFIDRNPVWTPG